jgi:DNA-binding NarL/FixJ family response regulator
MQNDPVHASGIRVLLADSKQLELQLLAGALSRSGFDVVQCENRATPVLELADASVIDVALFSSGSSDGPPDPFAPLRALHLIHPEIPKILLSEDETREVAVHAFRCGARALFCLSSSSFQLLCDCIERVHRGEICATTQQWNYLLDAVCASQLRVVSALGDILLTSREEQVVALVADGLSNRNVAAELGLSEHTVKKYLLRIFDKLGISSRVELVLYAIHHGVLPTGEWTHSPTLNSAKSAGSA